MSKHKDVQAESKLNGVIDALWAEASRGNHGETTQEYVRWFAKALLTHKDASKINPVAAEVAREALDTCRTMSDSNNDGISWKAAEKGIEALDAGVPSVLKPVAVPREHTEDEDCNCEQVGRALGWNAALAVLGVGTDSAVQTHKGS
jgi:hypothetical protein